MKMRTPTTLAALATTALISLGSAAVLAEDVTIQVWVGGGTGDENSYRLGAIEIAADILEREAAVGGDDLDITIDGRFFDDWSAFKQAVTLGAEAGTAPHIVVSGHEDIAPWAQSGLI